VIAREEERRRLRRDLHDDLAPTLAALALKASTLGDLILKDPTAATALTEELSRAIRAAVGDIRRLVYDLRPPTLDELGLIAAIRERVIHYNSGKLLGEKLEMPMQLQVIVDAPDRLPPLPAAVEVAAYRIIQEALTNVARHAQASTCSIRLTLPDDLEIEIVDNGIGLPGDHPIGVGLHSMRERAEELGGTCVIERTAQAGTRVHARLPVVKEETDGNLARPDRR
jgi:signal transduction histidine kinase